MSIFGFLLFVTIMFDVQHLLLLKIEIFAAADVLVRDSLEVALSGNSCKLSNRPAVHEILKM
jgi:hypothetical protein